LPEEHQQVFKVYQDQLASIYLFQEKESGLFAGHVLKAELDG
jgi:hypothetical protein